MRCENCQMEVNNSHTNRECDNSRASFYSKAWPDLSNAPSMTNPPNLPKGGSVTAPPKYFDYAPHFQKNQKTDYLAQKLSVMLHEIERLTQEYRLERNSEKCFLKLIEEIGEYSVAKLGDKPVTESPRQELVDVIIMAISLMILEGGNLNFMADYMAVKLAKWHNKIVQST